MGNWDAVAKVVNDRMRELGITQRELSERSGVSTATLRQIQQGMARQRSRATLAAISRTLGFPEDHLRDIALRGQTARDAGATTETSDLEELRGQLLDLRKRVEAIEALLQGGEQRT